MACGAGTQDDDGNPATTCTACLAGEYCAGGAALAEACAAGTQDDDGNPATECSACNVGTYCAGGNAAPQVCENGFEDDDSDPATPCMDINECLSQSECIPGSCENTSGSFSCMCPEGYSGTGETACTSLAQGLDCQDILEGQMDAGDGIYYIDPDGAGSAHSGDGGDGGDGGVAPFKVYCDMSRGGWTQLLDQDVTVGDGYLPAATWLNGVDTTEPNGGQWSALQHLNHLSSASGNIFMLRLTWDQSEEKSIEWQQMGSPISGSANSWSRGVMIPKNQRGSNGVFNGLFLGGTQAALVGEYGGAWAVGSSGPYGSSGILAFNPNGEGELVAIARPPLLPADA